MPNLEKEPLKLAHFKYYKNILNFADSVKAKLLILINGKVVYKSCIIDKNGCNFDNIYLKWDDYDLKFIIKEELGGYRNISIEFVYKKGKDIRDYQIICSLKGFYLIKAFYQKEIPNIAEVEEWILYDNKIYKLEHNEMNKDDEGNIIETQVFKSYDSLLIILWLALILGVSIPIIILSASLKLNGGIVIGMTSSFISIPLTSFLFSMPHGITYINSETIVCKTIYSTTKINMESCKIKYTKYKIIFYTSATRISIYKTKKALDWIKKCREDMQDD